MFQLIEHAKNAANLTNDLNDKLRQSAVGDITQVYTNGLYNSSTLALVVANLVDEILRSYGSAYGITYDLTNMSNMMSNSDGSLSRLDVTNETGNNTMSSHGGHTSVSEINNAVLVNMYRYQTAQLLSNVVNRLFSDKLSAQAPVNENITIGILEQSIKDLKYAIDNKVHAKALMEIVHMKIHPMLQSAYNLKLVVR